MRAAGVERATVLQVVAPAAYGGLERVVATLAAGLAARAYPVHVLVVKDPGAPSPSLVDDLGEARVGVTVVEVPHRRYRFERRRLREVARSVGARIVHTHGARVDVVDLPPARRLGLATVTTIHGFTGGSLKNRAYEWLQVRAARKCHAVVAVSRPLADRLRRSGVPAGRLQVIRNAWVPSGATLPRADARRALGVPLHGCRVGWVGRLTREKGADIFVEAMARLADSDVAASVIGDGPELTRLRARARDAQLGDRLAWHGALRDAAILLSAFDVLAITSRTEGTPMVLFEAIAAGVPVVATAVGGVPDVVTQREALLVPAEAPAAVAAALRETIADAASARGRAAGAQARVAEHFRVEPWLEAYESVYRGLGGG